MFIWILDISMSNVNHQFKILNITWNNYITLNNNLIEYLVCEGPHKIFEGDNLGKSTIDP